jgi:hypothetical protein
LVTAALANYNRPLGELLRAVLAEARHGSSREHRYS